MASRNNPCPRCPRPGIEVRPAELLTHLRKLGAGAGISLGSLEEKRQTAVLKALRQLLISRQPPPVSWGPSGPLVRPTAPHQQHLPLRRPQHAPGQAQLLGEWRGGVVFSGWSRFAHLTSPGALWFEPSLPAPCASCRWGGFLFPKPTLSIFFPPTPHCPGLWARKSPLSIAAPLPSCSFLLPTPQPGRLPLLPRPPPPASSHLGPPTPAPPPPTPACPPPPLPSRHGSPS